MCLVVCLPLEGMLRLAGVDVRVEVRDLPGGNHAFLRLPDGRVLDPTMDQLGDGQPEVYLGTQEQHAAAMELHLGCLADDRGKKGTDDDG